MQYQSFTKGEGSSDSFGKLEAIKMPDLKGKRFLDLGCNEGFFCNHAVSEGATRVVGIDKVERSVNDARERTPEAEFICSDWEDYNPNEKFDVIILLSAFHYAKSPSDLLRKIHGLLAKGGVFIFEGGIVENLQTRMWKPVTRGVGTVLYPTRALWERVLLKDFAFRRHANSVAQKGDPLPRAVYHCYKKLSNWTLVSGKGGTGKSTYAYNMDAASVIKLDWLLVFGIGRNSMFSGEPIVEEFIEAAKTFGETKIDKIVDWINTDERADIIAKHVIEHLPIEADLIIEGYLLSNKLFLEHFLRHTADLEVRVWHTQRALHE